LFVTATGHCGTHLASYATPNIAPPKQVTSSPYDIAPTATNTPPRHCHTQQPRRITLPVSRQPRSAEPRHGHASHATPVIAVINTETTAATAE